MKPRDPRRDGLSLTEVVLADAPGIGGDADEERSEQAAAGRAAEVRRIVEARVYIEQAKGMLMFIYGVDAETAFGLLRDQSQRHNVKLRLLAEQLVEDLQQLSGSTQIQRRLSAEALIQTAHQRIAHVADRQLDGQSKTTLR